MKCVFLFLFLSFFSLAVSYRAISAEIPLTFSGVARTAIVHTPAHYDPARTYPLMLVFHGSRTSAVDMEKNSGFNAVADQYGFIVAYPDSLSSHWQLSGPGNDIDFVEALLPALQGHYKIDPTRVYLSGISQGAGLAQRLACQHAGQFAGLASVSENLNALSANECHPSQPISALLFYGTDDPISSYNGGLNELSKIEIYSAQQTASFWAAANVCSGAPSITNLDSQGGLDAIHPDILEQWTNCRNGTNVTFYTLIDAGHVWPGNEAANPALGKPSHRKAGLLIWQTLSLHHL